MNRPHGLFMPEEPILYDEDPSEDPIGPTVKIEYQESKNPPSKKALLDRARYLDDNVEGSDGAHLAMVQCLLPIASRGDTDATRLGAWRLIAQVLGFAGWSPAKAGKEDGRTKGALRKLLKEGSTSQLLGPGTGELPYAFATVSSSADIDDPNVHEHIIQAPVASPKPKLIPPNLPKVSPTAEAIAKIQRKEFEEAMARGGEGPIERILEGQAARRQELLDAHAKKKAKKKAENDRYRAKKAAEREQAKIADAQARAAGVPEREAVNAVEKQSAAAVDVRQQTGNGETVGG